MTKDAEHFFKYFSAIHSSIENSQFSSEIHILVGLFGILESTFLRSLYILDIGLPLDVELLNNFQICGLLFCPTDSVLCLQKYFNFVRPCLLIFACKA